jgi:hypothetical protein
MQFKIKRPCEHCPFRKDRAPFLNTERAADLRDELRDDTRWFACHETTGVKSGRRIKPENQSQCAGSMMVLHREGRPNVAMRLALLFNLITIEDLSAPAPVFKNLDEFAKHHRRGRGR